MRRVGSTVAHANLRAGPGVEHEVLAALAPQTLVDVVEQHGYWLHVNAAGQAGYVHSRFVLLDEQGVANGFLRTRLAANGVEAPLAETALAPPDDDQLAPRPEASGLEKMVAAVWNRYGGLLTALSDELHIDPSAALAVLTVEAGGRGFGPDGRLIIRFENHIFFDKWGRNHEARFHDHFAFHPERRWMEHRWRPSADEPWREFHGDQAAEWEVFEFAREQHAMAAQLSLSMGSPRILGLYYAALGFESVQQMYEAFSESERHQIIGLFDFIQGPGTDARRVLALQAQDFEAFASMYNSPAQAGKYGSLLRTVYDLFHALRAA